jgi:hypothetical protein
MLHPSKVRTKMPRVWSNGLDVVVALGMGDLPQSLNNHYRVTGHTLRAASWQEVPDGTVLRVASEHGSVQVTASALRTFAGEGWVGRIAG